MTLSIFRAMQAPARRSALLCLVLAAGAAAGCAKERSAVAKRISFRRHRHHAVWAPAKLTASKGVPIAEITTALEQRLASKAPVGVKDDVWHHTQALYKSLGQTPLWFTSDGIAKDRARALTDAALSLDNDAIRTDTYPIAELSAAIKVAKGSNPTADQIANADVLLSALYASMGEDLLTGQIDPKSVGQAWHINPAGDDVDSALVHSLGDTLERGIAEMRPEEDDYAALQKELVRYRELAIKGGWAKVPAGKTLHVGQTDSPQRIAALRARLAAEGFAVDSAAGDVYDARLSEAVGQFQARHAIGVDKNLGAETVNSLNVPAAYRLGQIAANLERLRWLPHNLGSRYIYVNVPAFRLVAYDSGETSLEMKVIVGQDYENKATPVFSDSMEMVVFRPYWNITPDIQRSEIAPKIAADPGYMDRENLEYYSDGGVQRIRQKPGPKNSLGFVKFLFPNDYNIYLHDTPNHELFDKDVRAFSHGCIRVQQPDSLAQWVLGWDADQVHTAMQDGKDNSVVKLPKKIPVYITYGTAFMRDGQLFFGNDLYHRDDQLVKAVAEGALQNSAVRARLMALQKIALS
jgi:murein L,D-transpeptidase YcbB/YkuD